VRRWQRIILGLITLLLAALGWKTLHIYRAAQAVREDLRAVEAFAHQVDDPTTIAAASPLLAKLRGDVDLLRAEAAPFLPIARRLGWVPGYGPDLAAGEQVLDMLANLAAAADESCVALCPLVAERDVSQPIGVVLSSRLADAQPRLVAARAALDRAATAQSQIQGLALSPWLRGKLEQVATMLPTAKDALDLAIAAPDLLGANGPRSYLLLAQDVNEQRATGGFIGGAGVVTLDRGVITEFSLRDSYEIDDLAHHPYPAPPEPLRRYLGLQLWLFRDANWTADFPSAARQAIDLYRIGQGRELDGAIAFDESAVSLLLRAIGSVQVEGAAASISAENVVAYMHDQYSLNFPRHRKTFMEPLARAIVAKIAKDVDFHNLAALGRTIKRALDERHMLLYAKQAQAAGALARHGFDGAVRPSAQDFVMVIDSNVGYNKVFPHIAEAISYTVDLADPRAPSATLSIRHTNRQQRASDCSWQLRSKIARYEDYFVGCYWDYLRALVPADSRLIAADTHPTPGAWLFSGAAEDGSVAVAPGEGGSFSLETLVVVPMGQQRETTFHYRLPTGTVAHEGATWRYRLMLQKQPGTDALPIAIRVRLPPQAVLASASPMPVELDGDSATCALRLDHDQQIELAFTTP
jgi:hypothetical protein